MKTPGLTNRLKVKEVDTHIGFRAIAEPNPEWIQSWKLFLSQHESWWSRFASQGPVYRLPKPIIRALCGRTLYGEIIDEGSSEAELAFSSLRCRHSPTTIGVWDEQPIDYPLPFDLDPKQA
jgi:hypothetical protein